jgi:hypothetical protein
MSRPQKKGLEYFPLDVILDENVELFEAECGLEGYAILIKLWQKIYAEGYYIQWDSDSEMLLARRLNVEKTLVNTAITVCLHRDIFSAKLYKKYGILTSKAIQKRYFSVCKASRRTTVEAVREYLLVNGEFIKVITEFIAINAEETPINPVFSTQSKVKESKEKNKRHLRANASILFFDKFWDAYPKKKSKGQAEKTFKNINPDEQLLETMISTIERAKKSEDWIKENGKFIPYPSTWLNAQGWLDEYEPEKDEKENKYDLDIKYL